MTLPYTAKQETGTARLLIGTPLSHFPVGAARRGAHMAAYWDGAGLWNWSDVHSPSSLKLISRMDIASIKSRNWQLLITVLLRSQQTLKTSERLQSSPLWRTQIARI